MISGVISGIVGLVIGVSMGVSDKLVKTTKKLRSELIKQANNIKLLNEIILSKQY